MTSHPAAEFDELDLSIPNLHTVDEETQAGKILDDLVGVEAVRIIEQGAWISYRPAAISNQEICAALEAGGFPATIFQDQKTGETGSSPV